MAMVLLLEQELQDDHKKALDAIFDLLKAVERRDARQARQTIGLIDLASGPHWRWEEEALYPALRQFSDELVDGLTKEHDDYIAAVAELRSRFKEQGLIGLLRRGGPGVEDWTRARDLTRTLMYHLATCDGLVMWIEILGAGDKQTVRQAIFVARREGIPLLEWSEKMRQR